jgi:transposase
MPSRYDLERALSQAEAAREQYWRLLAAQSDQQARLDRIRLGLNNGRLEGLNNRIRLINHRSFGFHSADPLIPLVYLCCSRIVIHLPT